MAELYAKRPFISRFYEPWTDGIKTAVRIERIKIIVSRENPRFA
jgi:hypothetical protein